MYLQECDVGEQSIIHAVRSRKEALNVTVEEKCPLNKTPFCSSDCNETGICFITAFLSILNSYIYSLSK